MEQHISFYKFYIFCFRDFNDMQNINAKQNIVNSMWREDLKGCTYARSVTNAFLNISQYSQENTCVGFSCCRPSGLQLYWNVNLTYMFSSEYWEIFKNIYVEEHQQATASEKTILVCKKSTTYNRQKINCTMCWMWRI